MGIVKCCFKSTQIDKNQHYHQLSNNTSTLDLKSMHKVIKALSVATQGLVDGTDTPSRLDISTVKETDDIYSSKN